MERILAVRQTRSDKSLTSYQNEITINRVFLIYRGYSCIAFVKYRKYCENGFEYLKIIGCTRMVVPLYRVYEV